MGNLILNKSFFKYGLLIVLIIILILSHNLFDLQAIVSLTKEYKNILIDEGNNAILFAIFVFILRAISILIPIIPGTYCAIIFGYVYGIKSGLLLIFIADLLSCSSCFFLSRKLGRTFLRGLLGAKQMHKIERISKLYLEQNFFLMTGLLMTSWFDFVCYAVGLTNISWKKFMPSLILSILISDLPFVAGGYSLSQLSGVSFENVINGSSQVVKGPYLFLLIASALIIFGLGFINYIFQKRSRIND